MTCLAETGITVKIFSLKLHLGYIENCSKITGIRIISISAVFTNCLDML